MMNVMGKYPIKDWEIPIVTNVTTLVYPDTIVSIFGHQQGLSKTQCQNVVN